MDTASATAENEARCSGSNASTAISSSSEHHRGTKLQRRRNDNDRIKIDIGGRIFTTSKSTLTLSSTYFASKFKHEWNNDDDDDEDDHDDSADVDSSPPFVDQDPSSFAVLLQFMREGLIRKSKLTDSVLLQADFFGVDAILKAVKNAAFRYEHPTGVNHVSEDEACLRFDEKYGGILGAIQQGILPNNIKSSSPVVKKEYAKLVIFNKIVVDAAQQNPDPAYCTHAARIDVHALAPPYHLTFLDALNWLYNNGFVTKEEGQEAKWRDVNVASTTIRAQYWFSRKVQDGDGGNEENNNQACIVFDDEVPIRANVVESQERKQFAVAMSRANSDAGHFEHTVLMDVGKKQELRIVETDEVFQSGMTKLPVTFTSLTVVDLIGKLGFTQEEKDFESILLGIQRTALGIDDPADFKLTLVSRPI